MGFRLGCNGGALGRVASNLPSIQKHLGVARQKIGEEVSAGRVAGPFTRQPFRVMICSPIGLVPKSSPGEFRLIHHLSWPHGRSVNDCIHHSAASVKYSSFDQVVDKIVLYGKGALLAKADIKSAFRLLPVHPDDHHLLGFTFQGHYYYDMAMPFGCRSSCAHFERFAKFLNWCLLQECRNGAWADHYLDDYILVASNETQCKEALNKFVALCRSLGVPLASEKIEGPCTVIKFLGLFIDTVRMLVIVPPDKVQKALKLLDQITSHNKITLNRLQSIVGCLNFLCRAIRPGRVYLQRMIALTRGVRKPHHMVRITLGAKLDAVMWKTFLMEFNGSAAFLPTVWHDSSTLQFYTDASLTLGYGAYFAGSWFSGRWPKNPHNWSIAVCELIPIAIAILTWGVYISDKKVLIFCDNEAVASVLNKQSARCPKLMALMRLITLQCLRYNILIRSQWIATFSNGTADALSRHQIQRFRVLAPEADQQPTPTPRAREVFCTLRSPALRRSRLPPKHSSHISRPNLAFKHSVKH